MTASNATAPLWARVGVPIVVALLTLAPFSPLRHAEFLNWDDEYNFINNLDYRGLGGEQIKWMFTTALNGHYQPLAWVTLGLDYVLYGMEPGGYHVTSMLWHAASAVVLVFIARRLLHLTVGRGAPRLATAEWVCAGVAALLFSVHPLRVEPVAWLTERRDVLSTLFVLATLAAYLRACDTDKPRRDRRRWLIVAYALFVPALLSKVISIVLIPSLVVLDVWPLRRLGGGGWRGWFGAAARRIWLEKVPFVALAMPFVVLAPLAQAAMGVEYSIESYDWRSRVGEMLFGPAFYLYQTIWPAGLYALYEAPRETHLLQAPYTYCAATLAMITILVVWLRRRWPAGLALWLIYGLSLAPVVGVLASNGPQIAADRYTYLPCVGWAVLAGAGLLWCWRRRQERRLPAAALAAAGGAAAVVVVVLMALTVRQCGYWHDSQRLWAHSIANTGRPSAVSHVNLATIYADRHETDRAEALLRRALEIRPDYTFAYLKLGLVYSQRGDVDRAREYYDETLRRAPGSPDVLVNIGNIYLERGDTQTALKFYEDALANSVRPPTDTLASRLARKVFTGMRQGHPAAEYHVGLALAHLHRYPEAKAHFERAIAIRPDFALAHNNLGTVLNGEGDVAGAIRHYREAIRWDPKLATAYYNLAATLATLNHRDEAIANLRRALSVDPGYADAAKLLEALSGG